MEKIKFEDKILDAIKKDDLKSFSLLMPTNADLNLCYGRFPLLSLMYLYSSFKILSKFEKNLMPIHNFKVVDEPIEIYKTFKMRAKKSIRLFGEEKTVYPILMLAVLNERVMLNKNYKFLFKNVEINEIIQKIYKIKLNSEVQIEGQTIVLPPRKISFNQTILFSIISLICCLIIAFSGLSFVFIKNRTGLGSNKNPIRLSSKQEFVSALNDGKRVYLLENDVEIDGSEFLNKNFSGTLLGNGHTIVVAGEIDKSMIKNLSGKIENLKFKLEDSVLKITQNFGIFAENLSGKIENCEITGDFTGEFNSDDEIFAGMFVSKNSGEIINSNVSVSGSFVNNKESNAYIGNFAGVNDGTILSCEAKQGIVVADTVDMAGIACENNGTIFSSTNKITLSQTSSKQWHPNVAGVAIINNGKIIDSKNYAELNASSTIEGETDNIYYVFVGGISCENYGEINGCRNFGLIVGKGNISNVIAGGIVAQNVENGETVGDVSLSLAKSNIEVFSENGRVCVGGVVGLNAAIIEASGFIGNIDADSLATTTTNVFASNLDKNVAVFAGGVVGISQYSKIEKCYSETNYYAQGKQIATEQNDECFKVYAGLVGSIGVYAYTEALQIGSFLTNTIGLISKNYYVEKEAIKQMAFGIYASTFNGQIQSGKVVEVNSDLLESASEYFANATTALNKVPSLGDIPLEVLYE